MCAKFYCKKKIIFLALVFFSFFTFAHDGIMWGEKCVRVYKTKWFDIIYSEDSAQSAALLAKNADEIYCEIEKTYGIKAQIRMPVVLSAKREFFNAYFSVEFYNHIVIYDCPPTDDMAVFSNSLLSTFRHELTHAYTYNLKNKFWADFDKIISDSANPGGLFVSTGLSEGAPVVMESANGEGRLNDEYFLHIVKQAKIENCFPKYDDVQGASDKYPQGAYYNFNGAFNEWLQKKFGMEKYAQFWWRCVNFKNFTTRGAFKKVYGIKLLFAWEQFKNEFDVPQIPKTPFEFSDFEIYDFFSGQKKYSAKNNNGAIYTNLVSSKKNFAWLENQSKSIFLISREQAQKEKPVAKKLFCVAGAQKINLSQDGRLLVVSYLDQKSANYLSKIKIFDLQQKKWIFIEENAINNGAIVQCEKEYFLVCQKFFAQKTQIAIFKIDVENRNAQKCEEAMAVFKNFFCKNLPAEKTCIFTEFCDIENGKFVFLKKTGTENAFVFANVFGNIFSQILIPKKFDTNDFFFTSKNSLQKNFLENEKSKKENFAPKNFFIKNIKNLSYDFFENEIYFSYCTENSLPRIGKFNLQKKEFVCEKSDVSGGIFFPVKLNKNEFVYLGQFFRQNKLFKLKNAKNKDIFFASEKFFADENSANEKNSQFSVANFIANSKKYKAHEYFKKGLFLPISIVRSYSYDLYFENYGTQKFLPFGFTYFSNNPWNSNQLVASTGYSMFTNSIATMFGFSGQTDTELFKWKFQIQNEFDYAGWKQTVLPLSISLTFQFGKNSALHFLQGATIFLGRGNNVYYKKNANASYTYFDDCEIFPSQTNQHDIFYFLGETHFYYSNIHQSGAGFFEKFGIAVGISVLSEFFKDLKTPGRASLNAVNISPFFHLKIPKLIPIECKNFFVYNFPLNLKFSLFKKSNTFFNTQIETKIFAFDIQKAIPIFTAIFVNRFYISAGYDFSFMYAPQIFGIAKPKSFFQKIANITNDTLFKTDFVHIDAVLAFTPNFGIFANANYFYTEIKFETRYYFHNKFFNTKKWNFIFGISSNFNF